MRETPIEEFVSMNPVNANEVRNGAEQLGLVNSKIKYFGTKAIYGLSYGFNLIWDNPKISLLISLLGVSSDYRIINSIALIPLLIIIVKILSTIGSNGLTALQKGNITTATVNAIYFSLMLIVGYFTLNKTPFAEPMKKILLSIYNHNSVVFIDGVKKIAINTFGGLIDFMVNIIETSFKVLISLTSDLVLNLGFVFKDTKLGTYIDWLSSILSKLGSFLEMQGLKESLKSTVNLVVENVESVASTASDTYSMLKSVVGSWKSFTSSALPSINNSLKILGGTLEELELTQRQFDNLNIVNHKILQEMSYLYEYIFSYENLDKPLYIKCNDKYKHKNTEVIEYASSKCADMSSIYLEVLIKYKPETLEIISKEGDKELKLLKP